MTKISLKHCISNTSERETPPFDSDKSHKSSTKTASRLINKHISPAPSVSPPIRTNSLSAPRHEYMAAMSYLRGSSILSMPILSLLAITLALSIIGPQETEARMNIIAPTPPNQFYLNEFCDLHSKGPINKNKQKQDRETQLFLNNKNLFSSMRVQPETRRTMSEVTKRPAANGISFEFDPTKSRMPIIKQLNCFFVVVAPKSHGLLMNVNSIGLPKNDTQLTITLNHESNHSQLIHLEGEKRPSQYLLTQDGNSKIAIHLQSFKPIDWSHISFDILFTVYRKANNAGCPNKRWFDCGDNICVPASLVCDKTPHCPNGNDEMIFYKCYSSFFWSMAVTALLVLILVATISIVLFISRRRQGRLNRLNSLSDNVLTANADNISANLDLHNNNSRSQSYLKSNMFFNGFENPVWNNNSSSQTNNHPAKSTSIGVGTSNNNITLPKQLQHYVVPQSHPDQHPLAGNGNNREQHRPSLVDGHHLGLDVGVVSASGAHR